MIIAIDNALPVLRNEKKPSEKITLTVLLGL